MKTRLVRTVLKLTSVKIESLSSVFPLRKLPSISNETQRNVIQNCILCLNNGFSRQNNLKKS